MACHRCHRHSTDCVGTERRYGCYDHDTTAPLVWLGRRPGPRRLLHDMGPELADNFPQGSASGQEWRTAPLWGLGLLSSFNPNVRYLHDGRARSIEEAILWHAGQGASSRDRFKQLSADDRQSLID